MKRVIICFGFVALIGLVRPGSASCQPMINVQGGNVAMVISVGTPTGGPIPVLNTGTRIRYRRASVPSKITVSTVCPGQSFNLSVVATSASFGNPAPEVALVTGSPAVDFIAGILPGPRNPGTANLRYTASATYEQGHSLDVGNDVHVVTYTVVAQ